MRRSYTTREIPTAAEDLLRSAGELIPLLPFRHGDVQVETPTTDLFLLFLFLLPLILLPLIILPFRLPISVLLLLFLLLLLLLLLLLRRGQDGAGGSAPPREDCGRRTGVVEAAGEENVAADRQPGCGAAGAKVG